MRYDVIKQYSQLAEVVYDDVTVPQQLDVTVEVWQRLSIDQNLGHVRADRTWGEGINVKRNDNSHDHKVVK